MRLIKLLLLCALSAPGLFAIGGLTSITPNSGIIRPSVATNFTMTFANVGGNAVQISINGSNSTAGGCAMTFADSKWTLFNDGGGGTSVFYSTTTQSNSQCTVTVPSGGVGTGATITITFAAGFLGAKTIYWVESNNALSALGSALAPYPNTAGTFTISNNTAPQDISVTGVAANVNYGIWFDVVATVRDADGWGDLNYTRLIVGWGITDSETCDLIYWPVQNVLGLLNDAGSSWQEVTPGTAVIRSRGVCEMDVANSYGANVGTDVVVHYRIRFKPFYLTQGHSTIASFLQVFDNAGTYQDWTQLGVTGTLRTGPKLMVTTQK